MKRVMIPALMVFGLATFTPGQNLGEASQRKDEKQRPAQASPSPEALDFSDQAVHTISKRLRIVLTNKNEKPIYIRLVYKRGEHWGDFEAVYNECTGVPIEAGKSCNIDVVFSPRDVGPRSAFLSIIYADVDQKITFADAEKTQRIPLRGNGIDSNSEAGPTKYTGQERKVP